MKQINGYYQINTAILEDHAGETIDDIDKTGADYKEAKEAFELLLKIRDGKCDKPIIVTGTDEHSIPFYAIPIIGATVAEKNYWGIACLRYDNTYELVGRSWYIDNTNVLVMLEK